MILDLRFWIERVTGLEIGFLCQFDGCLCDPNRNPVSVCPTSLHDEHFLVEGFGGVAVDKLLGAFVGFEATID